MRIRRGPPARPKLPSVAYELGRTLLAVEAITPEALSDALFHATTRSVPFPRALVDVGAIEEGRLEETLERLHGHGLDHVAVDLDLVRALPEGLPERLYCVPLGLDEEDACVRVAVADIHDQHTLLEVKFHLGCEVKFVRASLSAVEGALARLRVGRKAQAPAQAQGQAQAQVVGGRRGAAAATGPALGQPTPRRIDESGIDESGVHESPPVASAPRVVAAQDHDEPNPSLESAKPLPHRAPTGRLTLFPDVSLEAEGDAEPIPLSRPRPKTPFPADVPAPPYPEVGALFTAIREAAHRDTVLDLMMAGARTVAKRVALFVVKKDVLTGFRCTSAFGDERVLRRIRLPLTGASVPAQAAKGGTYLGPLPSSPANAPLRDGLLLSGGAVAASPVKVGNKTVAILFADEFGDQFLVQARLHEFARASGQALGRILRAHR